MAAAVWSEDVTDEQLAWLRNNQNGLLRIVRSDGELVEGEILFVDDEHRDVVCELWSRNRPEKYK